jgi:CHAT domain-containing protein
VNTVGSGSYGRGLGRLVHAAGHAWRVAGDIERARVTLTLAADMAATLASGFTQREVLTELGDLFQAINSVGPAIASYQRALSGRLAEVGGADALGSIEPMTWLEIGELVTSMFKLHMSARDADDLARTAALATALLGRAPGGISARPAGGDLLELLEREREELAKLSADRMTAAPGSQPAGDFEERALTFAAEALASLVSQADVLVPFYQARQHQHEGDDADAAALFATALRRAGDQGVAGRSLQALVLGALGRHDEAQTVVADLLRHAPGIDLDEIVSLWASSHAYGKAAAIMKDLPPNATPGWRDLTQSGAICAGADDIDAAAGYLARASAAFEAWAAGVSRDAFRISIADDGTARDLYTVAASVALRQRRTGDAFALTDRLRSLALNELLRYVADRGHEQPTQSAAIRQWSQASAEWTGAYDLLAAAGNTSDVERIERAQTRLDTAQANLETAEKQLEAVLPRRLPGGRRTSTPPVALEQIQPLIPDDAVLVEYLVGWDRILIWAVDRHQAAASEMAFDTPRLSGMVRRFHRYCARRRVTADVLDDAGTLTRLLLDPVADPIRDYRRIVVVPSGPLHLMPFHALPFDGTDLGATRVVSVLPSASVLPYAIGRSRPAIDRGALVVGDPAYAPGRGLRQLPGTLVEARQVASRFNVTALVGSEATEECVGKAAEHAAVIHLATHGMVSAIAPTTSSVALAGSGGLTVADLMGLAIDADLVVLSACDTGRGDATLGGDVVGLVRGLLAAGARNAVVSLWPVDDEATCVLMDAFAQQLRTGCTIADALAAAQRSIRTLDAAGRSAAFSALAQATGEGVGLSAGQQRAVRDTLLEDLGHADDTHPYWWAPFVHVGV